MNYLSFKESFHNWLTQSFDLKLFESLPVFIFTLLSIIITIIGGIWFGNLAGRFVVRILEKRNVDKSVHHFLSKLTSMFIKLIFFIMVLSELGFNISSFVAALGAAGITAGLGLKDFISQFAGGIIILFNQPFKSGDFIEIEGVAGRVEEIHFMSTILVMEDNRQITIPNNHITTNNIINYTSGDIRRADLVFSIGYNEDIQKAKGVLYRTARDNPHVIPEPSPKVMVKEHAGSSVNLLCQVWCKSRDYWATYYSMQEAVKLAFDHYGIEIPYEQLDVHIKNNDKNISENEAE